MNTITQSGNNNTFIGLMSGTSMDSIDALLLNLSESVPVILCTHSVAINAELKQRLLTLCQSPTHPEFGELDVEMGEHFAKTCLQLIQKAKVDKQDIQAIGSHGQTIFHRPPSKEKNGFSLQIGDPNIIALRTGITTVADFRRKDMAAGGQGAPLVPAFHHHVFHSAQKNRVIVNIGGIANITVLSKRGNVTGFDTGPGNVLLDSWISKHHNKAYDENGNWGQQGTVNPALLETFLHEPFFNMPPPKSTGRELFNTAWLDQKLSRFSNTDIADVQATLSLLTAKSISNAINRYAPQTDEIFICGGGIHNGYVMRLLQALTETKIDSTTSLGVDPDWVEAAAFAWLARQTLERKPGNLPVVTGATKPVVLGGIYLP